MLGSKPEVGQQAIFTLPRLNAKPGQQVRFFIEASDIAIALTNPTDTSVQNRLAMVIDSIEPFGAGTFLVTLSGCGYKMQGLVTSQALSNLELKEGLYVTAMIKAVARASLKNSNA
jgi:molybdate transport system ATP-binding protein